MCRPKALARAQLEPIVDLASVDVVQQIFIRGDAERRRPILPFDVECTAVRVNLGKFGDWPLLGDNVAITPNAD